MNDQTLGGVSVKVQEVKEALGGLLGDIVQLDDKYCEDEIREWLKESYEQLGIAH